MIELIFSDSGAAALSMAMMDGDAGKVHAVKITMEKEGSYTEKATTPKAYTGPRLKGNRDDIASIWLLADMGDISNLTNQQARLNILRDISASHNFETDEWVMEEEQRATRLFQRLKDASAAGEDVRIWWSDAPGEICGFYWAVNFLQDTLGKIFSAKVEGMVASPYNGEVFVVRGTGELDPSDFVALSEHSKPLDSQEIAYLAKCWDFLVKENAPLRTVINGTLLSVEEDFYDAFLWKNMPEGEFRVADAIGLALVHGPNGMSDFWYASRLRYYIEKGFLQIVEEKETFYGSVIARTNKNID